MKNPILKLIAFALASVMSVALAHSETKDDAAIFDATALAHACLNCHSPNATTTNGNRLAIPNILNQEADTTYQLLISYQQEILPPNTTIMNRLLAAFNDEELKAIADAVSKIDLEKQ